MCKYEKRKREKNDWCCVVHFKVSKVSTQGYYYFYDLFNLFKSFFFRLIVFFSLGAVKIINAVQFSCAIVHRGTTTSTCLIDILQPVTLSETPYNINFLLPEHVVFNDIESVELLPTANGKLSALQFPVDFIKAFPKLRRLNLPANITWITQNDFKDAKYLIHLVLTGGNLQTIPARVFTAVPSLIMLVLRNNDIKTVEDHAFDGLKNLEIFSLSENKLSTITKSTFVNLKSLKALYLRFNNIESIEDGAFDMPNLRQLSLNSNLLKSFSNCLFAKLPELRVLTAEYNLISRVNESLYGLENLRSLMLGYNSIEDLDIKRLAKLPNLENLLLSGSGFNLDAVNITESDINATVSTVKILDLSSSQLQNGDVFSKLRLFKQLEAVNLSNNNISKLDLGVENPLIHTVKIDGNSLDPNDLEALMVEHNMRILGEGYIVTTNTFTDFEALNRKFHGDSVLFF